MAAGGDLVEEDLSEYVDTEESTLSGGSTVDNLAARLAQDYANYMKVSVTSEKQGLGESIDDLLTRLDEFCGLMDMVRSDDTLCLSQVLPQIYAKVQDLDGTFAKIDKLETFVSLVRQNVDSVEKKVAEAEYHLGGKSVKKLLTSLQKPLFNKKMPQDKRTPKYDSLHIFQTSDYFAPTAESSEQSGISAVANTVADQSNSCPNQPETDG